MIEKLLPFNTEIIQNLVEKLKYFNSKKLSDTDITMLIEKEAEYSKRILNSDVFMKYNKSKLKDYFVLLPEVLRNEIKVNFYFFV